MEDIQHSLCRLISKWQQDTGDSDSAISGLSFFRRESVSEPAYCLIEPSIVFVVQGAKQIVIGDEFYTYDTSNYLITSLDLPGSSRAIAASKDKPCLGLMLKLDFSLLSELIPQCKVPLITPTARTRNVSASLGHMDARLLLPFERLVALLDEPESIDILAPLLKKEIHYRLLMGKLGPLLRQIISYDSQAYRVSKAINWLKTNYQQNVCTEDLASLVQMSVSSFHSHFRQLTGMSPLQYQKWLRLNEAKRLMLANKFDAASAAFEVGYSSPSQFSREYKRLFGKPPKLDTAKVENSIIS
jgi:AraC-like DNA-binding protein